jgi:hypothetical protein
MATDPQRILEKNESKNTAYTVAGSALHQWLQMRNACEPSMSKWKRDVPENTRKKFKETSIQYSGMISAIPVRSKQAWQQPDAGM